MSDAPPPPANVAPPPPAEPKPPFARTAALFCAWSPLLGIVFNLCMGLGVLIMLAGMILGIVALCGIPKHGRKGILVPAVIGLSINIALTVVGIIGANIAIKKAEAKIQLEQQAR